jgi:hypothetical protein
MKLKKSMLTISMKPKSMIQRVRPVKTLLIGNNFNSTSSPYLKIKAPKDPPSTNL